jgi:hypothetical protein
MAINVFPAPSGGGVKSVQRGVASSAGTITITAVDITKTYVNSYGTAAAGSVPSTSNAPVSMSLRSNSLAGSTGNSASAGWTGGTTTLSAQNYGVSLTNSTTLTATGACRYEVVEML